MGIDLVTLISGESSILLWGVVIGVVALSIYLEQTYKWASAISGIILCMLIGMLLANIRVIPFSSPVYDSISNVLLLVAIPLLLFQTNVRKIFREGGRIAALFHLSAVGSVLGGFVAFFILGILAKVPNVAQLITMNTGAAVGGAVNIFAMASVFDIDKQVLGGYMFAGNFCTALYLLALKLLTDSNYFMSRTTHPEIDAYKAQIAKGEIDTDKPQQALYWRGRSISLLDIATALATTFLIVGIGKVICSWVNATNAHHIIKQLFGNIYLVMTAVTTLGATFFPDFFGNIAGADEMGTILLYLWFVVTGASANLTNIVLYGMIAVIIFIIVTPVNMIVTYFAGQAMKATWEEMVTCSLANIGGPPTVAALTVSMGWRNMIAPGILLGLWGYVIGNYCGVFIGNIIGAAF